MTRTFIKDLPNTVIILLCRFEYDKRNGVRKKVNTEFCFPVDEDLDRLPYTCEAVREMESRLSEFDRYSTASGAARQDSHLCEGERTKYSPITGSLAAGYRPREYYVYSLQGVVCHSGSAKSGHYFSFVRERHAPHEWYEFNDDRVHRVTSDYVKQEAFGGKIPAATATGKLAEDAADLPSNAYLLLYERKAPVDDWAVERSVAASLRPEPQFPLYTLHPVPPYQQLPQLPLPPAVPGATVETTCVASHDLPATAIHPQTAQISLPKPIPPPKYRMKPLPTPDFRRVLASARGMLLPPGPAVPFTPTGSAAKLQGEPH
jgi:hypothetical protein